MPKTKKEIIKTKTLHNLREILSDEIDKIRAGDTTPANVNAITNASGKIISTVKLELEYYKLIGRTPEIPFLGMITEKAKEPE